MLPLTDPETAGLSAASLSGSFKYWDGGEGQRGEGGEEEERGVGITMPEGGSFSLFVFLKK